MDKTTFYRNLSIFLLVLNLGTLGWLFLRRSGPPSPPSLPLGQSVVARLELDEVATANFYVSVDRHKEQIQTLNREKRQLLRQYFSPMTRGRQVDSSARAELLEAIASSEIDRILVTEEHFRGIEEISPPGKTTEYQLLIRDMVQRMLGGPRKMRRRPKES